MFTNSRKGFFSIGGSLTGFAFTGTVVDISLVFFLSILILDLTSAIVFLFSVKIFSLSTLSTFSADLVVDEFELGSSTDDLLSSIVFSLISSLLLFSILL